MRVADLMQTDVVTVSPDATLLQAQRLFVEEEINGAPVVDDDGRLVGVISSIDLVRAVQEGYYTESMYTDVSFYRRHDESEYSTPESIAPLPPDDRLNRTAVSDAMVTELVTIAPDADVAAAARMMREQHIHRVLVVKEGKLQGILTSFDLMSLLES